MRIVKLSIFTLSIITLIGLTYILLYPSAHENWNPVKTNALAAVPIEEMVKLKSRDIAKIAIDVSEYNSNYINGATARITELKYALLLAIVMLLISVGLLAQNVFKEKT